VTLVFAGARDDAGDGYGALLIDAGAMTREDRIFPPYFVHGKGVRHIRMRIQRRDFV